MSGGVRRDAIKRDAELDAMTVEYLTAEVARLADRFESIADELDKRCHPDHVGAASAYDDAAYRLRALLGGAAR